MIKEKSQGSKFSNTHVHALCIWKLCCVCSLNLLWVHDCAGSLRVLYNNPSSLLESDLSVHHYVSNENRLALQVPKYKNADSSVANTVLEN